MAVGSRPRMRADALAPVDSSCAVGPGAPLTSFVRRRPWLLVVDLALLALLAVLASADGGSVLSTWDEPIRDTVIDQHPSERWAEVLDTNLGEGWTVAGATVLAALVAAKRCRALAVSVVAAALTSRGVEYVMKPLIDRTRPPTGDVRLDTASFPSGHVLSVAVLSAMLLSVVALYTRRTAVRRAWAGLAAVMTFWMATSRVWFDAHWLTDVVASVLVALPLVLLAERAHAVLHSRWGWASSAHRAPDRAGAAWAVFGVLVAVLVVTAVVVDVDHDDVIVELGPPSVVEAKG